MKQMKKIEDETIYLKCFSVGKHKRMVSKANHKDATIEVEGRTMLLENYEGNRKMFLFADAEMVVGAVYRMKIELVENEPVAAEKIFVDGFVA